MLAVLYDYLMDRYDERLQVSTNQLKTLEDQNKKQQDEIKRFELHRVEKEKII
jgi:hypothetical protein